MPRYFAYGSNMSSGLFADRIPTASNPRPACLDGYRLVFSLPSRRWGGYAAGIEASAGDVVWGVVWGLDEADLARLDEYEAAYHQVEVQPRVAGRAIDVLTYVVREDRRDAAGGAPVPDYLGHMVDGAVEHGLPESWLDRLRRVPVADRPV